MVHLCSIYKFVAVQQMIITCVLFLMGIRSDLCAVQWCSLLLLNDLYIQESILVLQEWMAYTKVLELVLEGQYYHNRELRIQVS